MRSTLAASFAIILLLLNSCSEEKKTDTLFAGGFTEGDVKGLSVFSFDSRNGTLNRLSSIDAGPNPAYFCFSERRKLIYVANEVFEFRNEFGGGLTTLRYDPETNTAEKVNELLIPYAGPCFISLSSDSSHLFIANYPNGSIVVVKLNEEGIPVFVSDSILYVKEEPDRSHAHMILHDKKGENVYVTDLGLDRIVIYDFDSVTGKMIDKENGIVQIEPGSGPRHFDFSGDGSRLYLINEHGSTIMVFRVDDSGGLEHLQTVPTLKNGFMGNNYCADIHLSNDGKFLYGSNRGENSIVVFAVSGDGLLTLAGHADCGGDWPRNFTIDRSGKFLLIGNQKSDRITVLEADLKTGLPDNVVDSTSMKGVACLKFWQ